MFKSGSGAKFGMRQQPTLGLRLWTKLGSGYKGRLALGLQIKQNGYVKSFNAFVLVVAAIDLRP